MPSQVQEHHQQNVQDTSLPKPPEGFSGYDVNVAGQYYAYPDQGKGKVLLPYEVDVRIPEKIDGKQTINKIRSLIKNHILAGAIKAKYGNNYRRHRLIEIRRVIAHGEAKNPTQVMYMDYETLVDHIHQEDIPLNPAFYDTLDDLRSAVVLYKDDPDSFEKSHANQVMRKGKEVSEREALAELNPGLISKGGPAAPAPMPTLSPDQAPLKTEGETADVKNDGGESEGTEAAGLESTDQEAWLKAVDELTVAEATDHFAQQDDITKLAVASVRAKYKGSQEAAKERMEQITSTKGKDAGAL